jgi:hypothetical protein
MSARKCDTCRHLGSLSSPPARGGVAPASGDGVVGAARRTEIIFEFCQSPAIRSELRDFGYGPARGYEPDIDTARQLCDREGAGIFVHFEPLDDAPNGRTLDEADAEVPMAPPAFVQITRERARSQAA